MHGFIIAPVSTDMSASWAYNLGKNKKNGLGRFKRLAAPSSAAGESRISRDLAAQPLCPTISSAQ
jgi:hypothetical protein